MYAYAANNPVKYTDPDGKASILSRTINDSKTNKSYHLAHVLGEKTKFSPILHGLVDRGKLGGFKGKNSVYQYSWSKSGFTTNDAGSETSDYIIQYTGMDDDLTDQAAKNVLASEKAINEAVKYCVQNGIYSTNIYGENVTVVMKNGIVDTVYGTIKVTEEMLSK